MFYWFVSFNTWNFELATGKEMNNRLSFADRLLIANVSMERY